MSGGYTAKYIPNLGPEGCEAIKHFLCEKGGRYLGICAGAYIASSSELRISKSKMIQKTGLFICEIKIQEPKHPIFQDISANTIEVHYQNGPHIRPHKDERSLALYTDGTSSVLETSHAMIFSWHPERSPHTLPILFRSLEYLIHK